jgi:SAM-dependent methyltransferase
MTLSSSPNLSGVRALRKERIDPKELIAECGLDTLNHFSDQYYQRLPLPAFQMAKPWSMPDQAAKSLVKFGLILEGLDLGPTMRVLDFGAGTCWLSKLLWQLGCSVVSLEVSPAALELGRQLFEQFPVPYPPQARWEPLLYDGKRIELPDGSVDRIVMFDVFHHIPNPEAVAAECFRILRKGGIVAMSEPVGAHSSTHESQHEMREYGVLENDLHVSELADTWIKAGFSAPTFKVHTDAPLAISLADRQRCLEASPPVHVQSSIRDAMCNGAVLFFRKGERQLDSRRAEGLSHRMEILSQRLRLMPKQVYSLPIRLWNNGRSTWLCTNSEDRGIVKIGSQLLHPETGAMILDHGRWAIPHDVAPGESVVVKIPFSVEIRGHFTVRFDLVSEFVAWFRVLGSKEVSVDVVVE